jgi:hypothetical protein
MYLVWFLNTQYNKSHMSASLNSMMENIIISANLTPSAADISFIPRDPHHPVTLTITQGLQHSLSWDRPSGAGGRGAIVASLPSSKNTSCWPKTIIWDLELHSWLALAFWVLWMLNPCIFQQSYQKPKIVVNSFTNIQQASTWKQTAHWTLQDLTIGVQQMMGRLNPSRWLTCA